MPESESPKHYQEVEQLLDRLALAVEDITREVGTARQRADQSESECNNLRKVMSGSEGRSSVNLDERIDRIAADNQRLRDTLARAHDKAKRLRTRLAVVEDEV
jgi:predicted nuclease with TOPRIM domain|tara:strand:- start:609 stop:917 length:309 start_codon:yes stop_codon:yes gene_type:complete